jgi:hypothetical protein
MRVCISSLGVPGQMRTDILSFQIRFSLLLLVRGGTGNWVVSYSQQRSHCAQEEMRQEKLKMSHSVLCHFEDVCFMIEYLLFQEILQISLRQILVLDLIILLKTRA